MSFITKEELKSAIHKHSMNQITSDDDTIIKVAIDAAIQETKGYLRAYDTEKLFRQKGENRCPLLLQMVKTITVYRLTELANTDINYEKATDRYDRVVDTLNRISNGRIRMPSWSLKTQEQIQDGKPIKAMDIISRPKFKHY